MIREILFSADKFTPPYNYIYSKYLDRNFSANSVEPDQSPTI